MAITFNLSPYSEYQIAQYAPPRRVNPDPALSESMRTYMREGVSITLGDRRTPVSLSQLAGALERGTPLNTVGRAQCAALQAAGYSAEEAVALTRALFDRLRNSTVFNASALGYGHPMSIAITL